MEFGLESAQSVLEDGAGLFLQHSKEQEHDQTIPLDVDHDRYLLADDLGILRVFTVRDAGRLVGYACFCVGFSLRHKTSYQATQDSLYLAPEYRKGTLGIRFIRFIEEALRKDGVQVIRQHAHPETVLDRMLPRMGYVHAHNEYEKRIDKE